LFVGLWTDNAESEGEVQPRNVRRTPQTRGGVRARPVGSDQSIFWKKKNYKLQHWNGFVAFRPLLAEMRKGVAQWSAGDLHQPLERRVHLQDQEDRT
jgi:hypothetical protein